MSSVFFPVPFFVLLSSGLGEVVSPLSPFCCFFSGEIKFTVIKRTSSSVTTLVRRNFASLDFSTCNGSLPPLEICLNKISTQNVNARKKKSNNL